MTRVLLRTELRQTWSLTHAVSKLIHSQRDTVPYLFMLCSVTAWARKNYLTSDKLAELEPGIPDARIHQP